MTAGLIFIGMILAFLIGRGYERSRNLQEIMEMQAQVIKLRNDILDLRNDNLRK